MQEDLHCFALEAGSVETVLHDAREAPFAGFPVVPWRTVMGWFRMKWFCP
jgi:hypothetical protein